MTSPAPDRAAQSELFPTAEAGLSPHGEVVQFPRHLIFPIKPNGPVRLEVSAHGENYTLLIGGVSQQMGDTNGNYPCVTMRHLRVIVKMLLPQGFDSPDIEVRYADLLDYEGAKARLLLRRTLDELANVWLHRVTADGSTLPAERLVTFEVPIRWRRGVDPRDHAQSSREENILYRSLRKVRFAESFWRAFVDWSMCLQLRADVLNGIRSDAVAALYMVLAPDGYHPAISEAKPGAKDAARLMATIGATAPKYASDVRQFYEHGRGRSGGLSVLRALDGLPTMTGYLRVRPALEPNAQGNGFNVRFWVERREEALAKLEAESRAHGQVMKLWLEAGLEFADFANAQNPQHRALLDFERERLAELGYNVDQNRAFLEMMRSIIGPQEFNVKIGEAHQAMREGQIRDTAAKWLGGALMKSYREYLVRRVARRR